MKKLLLLSCLIAFFLNSKAQFVEGFENWNPYTILFTSQMNEPVGWSGSDSFIVGYGRILNITGSFQAQVFEESPGNSGNKAMRIASKFQDSIPTGTFTLPAKDYPGICTNSQIALDFVNGGLIQSGGTSIFAQPISTSMFVKNTVVGGDSTFINAVLIDDSDGADSIIAIADTALSSNITSFTKITLPFTYIINNITPTLVRYTISSGNSLAFLDVSNTFSVNSGTEIIVDDINLDFPSSVKQYINAKKLATVYPTVLQDKLCVDLLDKSDEVRIDIYAVNGQLISSRVLKQKNNTISTSSLKSGNYIYSLMEGSVIYQTGKLVK